MTSARILIVEDEPAMRGALRDILESEGHRVLTASDGIEGLDQAQEQKPDLLLLDVMLPQLDGYALCAELRRLSIDTPVLMLTAKGQVEERVAGLNSGADDYLVKPFSTDELLARVRALLRRSRGRKRTAATLRLGDAHIDLVKLTAHRQGQELHLTTKEFAILKLLAEAQGQPVTRERFLDLVWGTTVFPTTRTVDNHIVSLRSKLEAEPDAPRWILTIRGMGYKLDGAECDFADS